MRLGRLIVYGIFAFLIITAAFLYINSDHIISLYNQKHSTKSDEPIFEYVEAPNKNYSYIYDGKIFMLSGDRMTAIDFNGEELYQRVLKNDGYSLMGAKNFVFLIDQANGEMDIIDTENHLIMDSEPVNNVNGLKTVDDKIVFFTDDGLNFETIIFDENLDPYLSFLSKDASISLTQLKDGFKVLSLRRTESGLTTLLTKINTKKEIESLFELEGYVPIKLFSNSKGDIIVTDKEVILIKGDEVVSRKVYDDFYAMEQLDKNYLLISDGELSILDDSLNTITKQPSNGLDHVFRVGNRVIIYGGREFNIIGDNGVIKSVKTERDIEKIHYDGHIVVEFRNGFLIYKEV